MDREKIHLFTDFFKKTWMAPAKGGREYTEFEAWIDILCEANTEGICDKSLKQWSERWRWNKTKAKRYIDKLDGTYINKKPGSTTQFHIRAYHQWKGAPAPPPKHHEAVRALIDHFNTVTKRDKKTAVSFTEKRRVIIAARLNEGTKDNPITVEDCKMVITHFNNQWKDDDKMKRYIRFETLFQASKFQNYLEEARAGKATKKTSSFFDQTPIHQ